MPLSERSPASSAFEDLFKFNPEPQLRLTLAYATAPNYEARFEALEKLIDKCYRTLVDGRAENREESEDQLSQRIVDMLKFASVNAEHDTKVGGHCDIIVRGPEDFLWIGEAKVHKSYQWLVDGFLQLSRRYATGLKGRNRGEIVIYHREGKSRLVLEKWRQIIDKEFSDVTVTHEISDGELCFRTSHICPNSGLTFHVRHCIIPLMHKPVK